jgi:hypothetical protein
MQRHRHRHPSLPQLLLRRTFVLARRNEAETYSKTRSPLPRKIFAFQARLPSPCNVILEPRVGLCELV